MYTLFYSPFACSLAVHMALEKVGNPFRLEKIDIQKGEHQLQAYGSLNHRKKVPLLKHDDVFIDQGAAILIYLADLHPETAMMPPSGADERSAAISMLFYLSNTLHPAFSIAFHPERFTHGKVDELFTKAIEKIETILSEFNEQLATQDYLTGNHVFVADYYLMSMLNWLPLFSMSLACYPHLAKYQQRMADLPEVQRAFEKEASQL
ncbi:MAG: glutathione S-transferase family protein [Hahellaceae bacterium]|nr:glutathione S-transferase family protein [Hahellaceae bacterium]MCP5212516.1 glutathione S-transferase family protein [Hahellaceae bacterium]